MALIFFSPGSTSQTSLSLCSILSCSAIALGIVVRKETASFLAWVTLDSRVILGILVDSDFCLFKHSYSSQMKSLILLVKDNSLHDVYRARFLSSHAVAGEVSFKVFFKNPTISASNFFEKLPKLSSKT